jgi:hypothetical protein
MADYVMLLRYINDLGCSTDRAAGNYCPVITLARRTRDSWPP